MSGAGFIQTLVQAREAGVVLTAEPGALLIRPESRIPPGLQIAIRALYPDLIRILRWNDETARELILDALCQLEEFYLTGAPAPVYERLRALEAPTALISRACERSDMHLLRVVLHLWVRAGINAHRDWTGGSHDRL